MRWVRSHASDGPVGGRGPGPARYVTGQTIQALMIASLSAGLLVLVSIYGNGLRDPRYLDGWVLACGMGLQLCLHIAVKTGRFSPRPVSVLRAFHVFLGLVLIAAFTTHSDFSLPDTGLEWALWLGFVLVTASGIFGIYLAWSKEAKHAIDEPMSDDRMAARRAEFVRTVEALVATADPSDADLFLPAPPYHAWIVDLYANHLRAFFHGTGNFAAHLTGSQRQLKQLTVEIDSLARFVDNHGQEKLNAIRSLVVEKHSLDRARVQASLAKGWLFVHVPVTYALVALTVLHVLVVYAFSSGVW